MSRWILKFFYLFGWICSSLILTKLLAGQTYTAYVVPSDSNATESWPSKMRLRLINYGYFCKMPSFNIDIDEESVASAWYLPPKTQLSPIMREIGRCHLAAKKMASEGIKFDENKCNCVGWWPVVVFALVLFCFLFNLYRFIFGLPMDKEKDLDNEILGIVAYCVSLVWCICMILIFLYGIRIIDVGISYTTEENWFSRSYYSKSRDWGPVLVGVLFCGYAGIAEIAFLAREFIRELIDAIDFDFFLNQYDFSSLLLAVSIA